MSQQRITETVLKRAEVDPSIVSDLQSRDVALWLGKGIGEDSSTVQVIARLAALPWQTVAVESHSAVFASALESLKDDERLVPLRGYLDVIAANPEDIPLPARTLPVFFLNGRDGSDDQLENPTLTRQKAQLRRLNMLKRLQDGQPRHLVVVSNGDASTIEEVAGLWEEGFRSRLTVVTLSDGDSNTLQSQLINIYRVPAVSIIAQDPTQFADHVCGLIAPFTETEKIVIRICDVDKHLKQVDVTSCDRPDQPLLDKFDLLHEKQLTPILPDDLTELELESFFQRSSSSWRPFAAGLPWVKDDLPERQMLNSLRCIHNEGEEASQILVLSAEPGAGGTTLMKYLAFVAASHGYPTLVARPLDFNPDASEIMGFLFAVHQARLSAHRATNGGNKSLDETETPALIAFDTQHWRGQEDAISGFLKSFVRSGRPVALLVVTDSEGASQLPREVLKQLDSQLQHDLTEEDAVELGRHLNRFLEPKQNSRSLEEWRYFHNMNSPRIGDFGASGISFWITLEFWLKRQLQLGESIQDWLYSQFTSADFPPDVKLLILRIAALTVERIGMPEDLMPVPPQNNMPYSIVLDNARQDAPALGLFRSQSASQKQWVLGHVQIARYLLNVAFRDRPLLESLGFGECFSPIHFRLGLLESIACNPIMGQLRHLDLAIEFAKTIFKLDRDGNREFFTEWARVLAILERMPERVWLSSRAFNHHVAISRRRVAADQEYFPLSPAQQEEQLEAAAEHLQFALERIEETDDDDSNLNLLNSLARCYQDLAQLKIRTKAPVELVAEFRSKATDCIRQAKQFSATNSYVLETLAKDLIQSAQSKRLVEPVTAALEACEALSHVRQALSLETAASRQMKLNELLTQSFNLLTDDGITQHVQQMRARREPIGIVAAAWLELRAGVSPGDLLTLDNLGDERIDRALSILEEIPAGKQSIMDIRLAYDLVAVRFPYDFRRQLALIESIIIESPRTDFQTRLEFGILLFQVGRVPEGKQCFDDLRRELRQTEAFVVVPDRLKLLRKQGVKDPQVCTAVVVEERDVRSWAAVQDLKRERVPFIAREFDRVRMPERQRFQCLITFGPNGPFIKPVR